MNKYQNHQIPLNHQTSKTVPKLSQIKILNQSDYLSNLTLQKDWENYNSGFLPILNLLKVSKGKDIYL